VLASASEGRMMLSKRRAGGLCRCVWLLPLPLFAACTLTADGFSPELLAGTLDAGALLVPVVTTAPSATATDELGCSRDGAEGALVRGESCSGAIGLLAPGADAGLVAPAELEPLSLPPCNGELGEFNSPERITGLGLEEDIYGPALSLDGRTLYFSAYVSGQQQLYSATRSERGAEFSAATELSGVNSTAMDGTPFIAANGERFYFFSDREEGLGNRDIWFSEVSEDGAFGSPELVPGVNTPGSELLPWLSPDERTMIFVSSRPGGRGAADIWRATRADVNEAFGAPSNVFELSSNQNEGRAVLSRDGLTAFFTSDRNGGRGGPDIYAASRPNLGSPFSGLNDLDALNSAAADLDVMLSPDETELYFASARGGVNELWLSARSCAEGAGD
jgi:hypothetical protein